MGKKTVVVTTIAITLGGVALLGFVKYRQIAAAIANSANFAPPPDAVPVVEAVQEMWPQQLELVGSLTPIQGALLSVEAAGRVAEINFEPGSEIKEGSLLMRLDTSVEDAQLASASARLDLGRINFQRMQTMRASNMNSVADLDKAHAEFKQGQADVEQMKALGRRKTVLAPFDGVVGVRQVQLGQYVEQGAAVTVLEDLSKLYVRFSLPQRNLAQVRVGQKISVNVDAYPKQPFSATVSAINPRVDDVTRNFLVEGTIENPERLLRPGMFVKVLLDFGESTQLFTIPGSAVSYAPYGDSVFVVETKAGPDGKEASTVRQQFVTVSARRGDQVGISEGLKPGEKVVTAGVFKLRPGGAVQITDVAAPGNEPNPNPANT